MPNMKKAQGYLKLAYKTLAEWADGGHESLPRQALNFCTEAAKWADGSRSKSVHNLLVKILILGNDLQRVVGNYGQAERRTIYSIYRRNFLR